MTIQNEQFGGPLKVPIPRGRETIPGQGASSRASVSSHYRVRRRRQDCTRRSGDSGGTKLKEDGKAHVFALALIGGLARRPTRSE
jgi:hypothetical protein